MRISAVLILAVSLASLFTDHQLQTSSVGGCEGPSALFGATTVTTLACTAGNSPTPPADTSAFGLPSEEQAAVLTITLSNGATCTWRDLHEPADSDRWAGRSPSDGSFAGLGCGAPPGNGSGQGSTIDIQFVPNAAPGEAQLPPPPDPNVVAQVAIDRLQIPTPSIQSGPDPSKLAVNLWTWLWIDDPGTLSATAAVSGVSVTATATLSSATWSLGEPAPTGGPYAQGPPLIITCRGAGTAPLADYDWKTEPPCGHKYSWMSTKERTGGSGKWPVTATSNWTVTWQSNTGVSGSGELNATGNDALEIGEYRTVLVQGPGG